MELERLLAGLAAIVVGVGVVLRAEWMSRRVSTVRHRPDGIGAAFWSTMITATGVAFVLGGVIVAGTAFRS